MSKFTGGEWKVIQGAGLDELDVISEDKKDICCLFSYSISRWEEQKANARLIAAAPEMYRLLKEVLMLKEELMPTSDCGGILSFSREMKIRAVLDSIDGKEEITTHEGTE